MNNIERTLEYLTDIHPYEEAGVMYDGSDGRQLICSSKDNVSAMIADDEGISGQAWIALDQVHAPYGVQYAGSRKERTLPESYYAGGCDVLMCISPTAGNAEAAGQKEEEIRQALERWYIYINEEIACGGSRYLIIRVSDMDKSTAEHNDTIMRLLNIIKMLHMEAGTKIAFSMKKCRMYPLPGTGDAVFIKADTRQTTHEYIKEYVTQRYPAAAERAKYNAYRPESFDMGAFIKRHQLYLREPDVVDGAKRYTIPCPWCGGAVYGQQAEREARIIHRDTGEIAYICPTCLRPHTWEDLRRKYEPTEKERQQEEEIKAMRKSPKVDPSAFGEVYKKTNFIDADDMLYISANEGDDKYIPTGITDLDREAGGLANGMLSVWFGLSGAGKSTLLTEVMLNAVDAGYNAGMISKELDAKHCIGWSYLIAAGDENLPGQIQGQYYTPYATKKKITDWWRGKFFIDYNCTSETKAKALLTRVKKAIEDLKLDLMIIDNLMMLDISEYSGQSEYTAQNYFMKDLKNIAEETDCHIILCAHPRKPEGLVRLNDLKGSGDIRGIADQIFIIHRVDDDFIRNMKAIRGWKDGTEVTGTGEPASRDPRFDASNLVEIGKNRYNGKIDIFIRLYYDSRSKRLKNYPGEVKHYGWEMLMDEE